MRKNKTRIAIPTLIVALLLAASFTAPAFASAYNFDGSLPAWQENVSVHQGWKSNSSSTNAYTLVYGTSPHGGIFWIDKSSPGNRVTDSSVVDINNSGYLYYYWDYNWTGTAILRGCQIGWGPNPSDYVAGYINYG